MKNVSRDSKLQGMIEGLEEAVEGRDSSGDKYEPLYLEVAQPNGDVDEVYTGKIVVRSAVSFQIDPDAEQAYPLEVASVDSEQHAIYMCNALNALPDLLNYIRQLQAAQR